MKKNDTRSPIVSRASPESAARDKALGTDVPGSRVACYCPTPVVDNGLLLEGRSALRSTVDAVPRRKNFVAAGRWATSVLQQLFLANHTSSSVVVFVQSRTTTRRVKSQESMRRETEEQMMSQQSTRLGTYVSYVLRVCVSGQEGTGKTTSKQGTKRAAESITAPTACFAAGAFTSPDLLT